MTAGRHVWGRVLGGDGIWLSYGKTGKSCRNHDLDRLAYGRTNKLIIHAMPISAAVGVFFPSRLALAAVRGGIHIT